MPKIAVKKNIKIEGLSEAEQIKVKKMLDPLEAKFERMHKANAEIEEANKDLMKSVYSMVGEMVDEQIIEGKRILERLYRKLDRTSLLRFTFRRHLKKDIATLEQLLDNLEEISNDSKKHA